MARMEPLALSSNPPQLSNLSTIRWRRRYPRKWTITSSSTGTSPNEKARKKFVAAGFSRVTCLYFPKAPDDRIHFACRQLTVLFLIDDLLEYMLFEEGSAYNEKLMTI